MKLSKLLGFLSILCGIAVMAGPWTFAGVCAGTDSAVHTCLTTRLYALAAGAIILALGLLLMKIKVYFLDKLLALLLFAAGIGTISIPIFLAPVCDTRNMHCRTLMLPFLIGMGTLVAFLGILFLLKGVKREKPEPARQISEADSESSGLPSEPLEATYEEVNNAEGISKETADGAVRND